MYWAYLFIESNFVHAEYCWPTSDSILKHQQFTIPCQSKEMIIISKKKNPCMKRLKVFHMISCHQECNSFCRQYFVFHGLHFSCYFVALFSLRYSLIIFFQLIMFPWLDQILKFHCVYVLIFSFNNYLTIMNQKKRIKQNSLKLSLYDVRKM